MADKQVIDRDFVPPLTMTGCHDMRFSNDVYRVLQVDDEGGQGNCQLESSCAESKIK